MDGLKSLCDSFASQSLVEVFDGANICKQQLLIGCEMEESRSITRSLFARWTKRGNSYGTSIIASHLISSSLRVDSSKLVGWFG